MNPILRAAIAHFDKQGVKYHDVQEWAEDGQPPVRVYFTPMTLADQQRVQTAAARQGDLYVLVETIILKATDKDGKRLFTVADRKELATRTDRNVLARVCTRITAHVGDDEIKSGDVLPEGGREKNP